MLNIYAELVKGDYDVPGALAYAVYKRSKAEEKLARDFAAKSVEEKMEAIEAVVMQSEVIRGIFMLDERIKLGFASVEKKLNEKKTLRAWGRDIVTAFIAGLGVILAVGLLFNGYVRFAAINATAEKAVGIDLETPQRKAAPLRK